MQLGRDGEIPHGGNGSAQAALVLLSGGLDSATCLYWARQHYGEVYAITFDYRGRLEKEKQATGLLAKAARVSKFTQIDLPFLKEMSEFEVAERQDPLSDSRWSSYIPARNMIFYSIAAFHAEALGINAIVGGHNAHDSAFFKDSSLDFFDHLNNLLERGCLSCDGKTYKIILPLVEMTRQQIIRLAMQLGVPIDLTWSCHEDDEVPCGRCYACKQRAEAFEALKVSDPALIVRQSHNPKKG